MDGLRRNAASRIWCHESLKDLAATAGVFFFYVILGLNVFLTNEPVDACNGGVYRDCIPFFFDRVV